MVRVPFARSIRSQYNKAMKLPSAIVLLLLCWPALPSARAQTERVDFDREVRPILERSCWKCHGPEKQKAGLRFDRRPEASKAITPGQPADSELIRRVETASADERMPPKSDPLPREQIKVLRAWIEQGANWPETTTARPTGRSEMVVTDEDRQHWSYRPLQAVAPPTIKDRAWCRTPIDRLLVAPLEARGLRPNEPA